VGEAVSIAAGVDAVDADGVFIVVAVVAVVAGKRGGRGGRIAAKGDRRRCAWVGEGMQGRGAERRCAVSVSVCRCTHRHTQIGLGMA
ncbi:hypothetical protein COCVIDRAFT_97094, partial [Bipolaris victoriae FI3]